MKPYLIAVSALEKYQLHLTFDDDTVGTVSPEHLANKGVFCWWNEEENFAKVHINAETNAVAWNESIYLDTFNLYLKIKGISFEQWQQNQLAYATN